MMKRAPHEPAAPLRTGEDQVEPLGMLEVPDQQTTRCRQEDAGDHRGREEPERARPRDRAGRDEQQRGEVHAGRDALRPRVRADAPVPWSLVRDIVRKERGRGRITAAGMPGTDLPGTLRLRGPGVEAAFGAPRGDRVEGRLVRAFVEELRSRIFFRTPHGHRFAGRHLGDFRRRIVHVADEDRLRRAHDHARRFETAVDPVRAEVTLFGRMVGRVDEDRVVRARGHARFAPDADRLVEVDDPVFAHVHRARGASGGARRVGTLVAARHLERAPHLGEDPDVDRFDVGARDREGHVVLGFARGRAGVASDAARLVDDLRPLLGDGDGSFQKERRSLASCDV